MVEERPSTDRRYVRAGYSPEESRPVVGRDGVSPPVGKGFISQPRRRFATRGEHGEQGIAVFSDRLDRDALRRLPESFADTRRETNQEGLAKSTALGSLA